MARFRASRAMLMASYSVFRRSSSPWSSSRRAAQGSGVTHRPLLPQGHAPQPLHPLQGGGDGRQLLLRLLRGALRPRQALRHGLQGLPALGPPARQTAFWPPPAWSGPDPAAPPGSGPGRGRRSSQTGRTPPGQRRGQRRADRPGCSPAGLSGPPVSPAPPSPVGRPPGPVSSRPAVVLRQGGDLLPAARPIPGQHLVRLGGGPPRPAQGQDCGQGQRPAQAAPPRSQGRKLPSSTAPRAADRTSSARPTLRRRGKRRFSLRRAPVPPARGPRRRPARLTASSPLIPLKRSSRASRRACS